MSTTCAHPHSNENNEQNLAEALLAFREVQAIYLETMQIMRDAELALHPHTIRTTINTESAK